jgi:hypothetical protein
MYTGGFSYHDLKAPISNVFNILVASSVFSRYGKILIHVDQFGRIFANWAIVFFGQFLKNTGPHFGRWFNKLIW